MSNPLPTDVKDHIAVIIEKLKACGLEDEPIKYVLDKSRNISDPNPINSEPITFSSNAML